MKHKLIHLLLSVMFASATTVFPQSRVKELIVNGGCNYDGQPFESKVYTFESDAAAVAAVDRILDPLGLARNFDVRAADVRNAAAVIQGETRYLLYNQEFIRRVKAVTRTDWAAISIMAHEIGHHLNGHTLVPGGSRPPTELEADSFSGFVLYKMGATLEQAQAAMNAISSEKGSATHPSRRSRLAAIEAGWAKAQDQDTTKRLPDTTEPTERRTTGSSGELVSVCGYSLGTGISTRWVQIGGANSVLGCPATSEMHAAPSPQGTSGRYAEFEGNKLLTTENGAIYWHRTGRFAGRAFVIYGGIYNLYEDMGRSSSWLGFPISDEFDAPGGRRSNFEGGYIFRNSRTFVSQAFRY